MWRKPRQDDTTAHAQRALGRCHGRHRTHSAGERRLSVSPSRCARADDSDLVSEHRRVPPAHDRLAPTRVGGDLARWLRRPGRDRQPALYHGDPPTSERQASSSSPSWWASPASGMGRAPRSTSSRVPASPRWANTVGVGVFDRVSSPVAAEVQVSVAAQLRRHARSDAAAYLEGVHLVGSSSIFRCSLFMPASQRSVSVALVA